MCFESIYNEYKVLNIKREINLIIFIRNVPIKELTLLDLERSRVLGVQSNYRQLTPYHESYETH